MNNTNKPWPLLISIYTTQYIGVAFIISAAFAILRQDGIALNKLAMLNMIAFPMLGKILYAPFVDGVRIYFHGQYRSWLIIAQSCMVLLLLISSFIDIHQDFSLLVILMVVYAFFMSVQDVAIDGLACKLFPEQQRQFANSIQYASNLCGNIIGGGLLLILYPWLQWSGAFVCLAALTSITLFQLIAFKEPDTAENAYEQKIIFYFKDLCSDLKKFIVENYQWFFLLLLYPLGFSAVFGILNPMLVDAKWSLQDIGVATKIFGSFIGIVSAFIATLLINKHGRIKALIGLNTAQGIALLFFIPLCLGYATKFWVYCAIFAYFIVNIGLMTTISTIIMDRAAKMSAKATFFSLQLSLIVFMGFTYSSLGLIGAQHVGYLWIVSATIIFSVLISVLTWKLMGSKI